MGLQIYLFFRIGGEKDYENEYQIEDREDSDDSGSGTDDDDDTESRKKQQQSVPEWAKGPKLREALERLKNSQMEIGKSIYSQTSDSGTENTEEQNQENQEEAPKDEEKKDEKKEEKEPMIDGMPESFIGPMLADLTCHEVGHTLGLRHNFT